METEAANFVLELWTNQVHDAIREIWPKCLKCGAFLNYPEGHCSECGAKLNWFKYKQTQAGKRWLA